MKWKRKKRTFYIVVTAWSDGVAPIQMPFTYTRKRLDDDLLEDARHKCCNCIEDAGIARIDANEEEGPEYTDFAVTFIKEMDKI